MTSGTIVGGRYRVGRKLADRSFGALYEAHDEQGQRLSVEIFSLEQLERGGATVARFLDGARAAQRLRGRGFVQTHALDVDASGAPFLVCDAVDGEDLEQVLVREGALSPEIAVRIALQVASALAHAHRAGVVHRDVRPGNLQLAREGDELVVKVVDFGLARDEGIDRAAKTEDGSIVGTPLYMSPEQARGRRDVDGRADVFALAIVLWEMLAGRPARSAHGSLAELMISLCSEEVSELQEAAPWIDPRLASVVHGALLLDRDARCPSMEAFADALRAHAGGSDRLLATEALRASDEVRRRTPERAPRPVSWATAVEPGRDRLIGATLAQRYRLVRCIGRGGMGAVYEAITPEGDRLAVKVIHESEAHKNADARRRFVREARAASQIVSDHVVEVLEADSDPATGAPFIVMELLEGIDLEKLIARAGAHDATVVTRLFVQACRGVAAAHARGTVHRDIKPANIFLAATPDGEVRTKICDFGIAKTTAIDGLDATTAALTKTGGMLGSPAYMSPEQARNARHVDARSDVWSLSLSMYEAYSGVRPWAHCSSLGEMILAICTEELTPLHIAAPWIPPELSAVVHRGLRRDPKDRWQTVEELAAALAPFTNGGERVTRDMLIPLDDHIRARAPLLVAQGIAHDVVQTQIAPSSSTHATVARSVNPAAPARSRRALWFAGAAALAIGLGVAALVGARRPPAPPLAAPPSVTTTSAPPSVFLTVPLRIVPDTAKVIVDGVPRAMVDGAVYLQGQPGDTFTVVVTAGSARVEREVAMLRGGLIRPDLLELGVAPTTSASVASAPPASAKAAGPKATAAPIAPKPSAANPAATAKPTATAKTVPTTTTAPTFQKDW